MKNKILLMMLLIVTTLSFNNCSDLEENPRFSLDSGTVFSTQEGAKQALNGVYALMAHEQFCGQWMIELCEDASGIGYARQATWMLELAGLNISESNVLSTNVWRQGYSAISNMNIFLKNLESSPLDDGVKSRFKGEVLFLRGFVYFQLTGMFGGLPIHTEPVGKDTADKSRSTRSEVYNQIEADLFEAIDNLKDKESLGQINEWACRALLAKIYFMRASQEDGTSGTQSVYWQKAKEQGDLVINQGAYSLDNSLTSLFDGTGSSPEVIFKLNFNDQGSTATRNGLSRIYSPPQANTQGQLWFRTQPSRSLYNFHADRYPGDPRMDVSYFHKSYTRYLANTTTFTLYPDRINPAQYRRPFYKKYFDINQNAAASTKDIIFYRYADLLLLMADVENELGNQPKALDYVNQVLGRARNSDGASASEPADWTGMSKEDFRYEIYLERHLELLAEGKAYVEVRRRGTEFFKRILERHNNNPNNDYSAPTVWASYTYDTSNANLEKNLLMPIPRAEISFNLLINDADQNPGY